MVRKAKQLTAIGMLCALAYAATVIGRVPCALFEVRPQGYYHCNQRIDVRAGRLIGGCLTCFICRNAYDQRNRYLGVLNECYLKRILFLYRGLYLSEAAKIFRSDDGAALRMGVHGFRHAALERSHCPYLHGLSQRSCQRIAHPGISPL